MQVDTTTGFFLDQVPDAARRAEQEGYDGLWTAETSHDPFLPHVLAAEHTERISLGTSIAVAFARNPMLLANLGYDLNAYSGGRFVLGLGSQIKPHITKRFSMEWSKPAARMRELVLAIRAIWACWNEGTPLDFRGEFYTHTLMTPFFNPGPNPHGDARIFIAGVGPLMTRVAGEVCDGFLVHGFTTEQYLKQVTVPALEEGMAMSGRDRSAFEISYPAFVVTGETEEAVARNATAVKQQISFYASTPAYRDVLEQHGWGELQTVLNNMSKLGEWAEMTERIDDEVLRTFAVVAEPEQVAPELVKRFGGVVDRISFYAPYQVPDGFWLPIMEELQAA